MKNPVSASVCFWPERSLCWKTVISKYPPDRERDLFFLFIFLFDGIIIFFTCLFRLYQKNCDRMETVFEDVDLLKRVVADHSEKLQKLA